MSLAMPAFVRFWGTRGSIPTPGHQTRRYGGNTSCVELRMDGALLVCDGGTGLRELGLDLRRRMPEGVEAHLFFSHMHWDHIQGFPFFVPAYSPESRLHVYETTPGDDRVRRLLHGQMKSEYFPVSFSELGATIEARYFSNRELWVRGVRVRCFEQPHPGRSFAFSFEHEGKKIVYATDSELDSCVCDPLLREREPEALRRLPADLVRFIEGADLLIADGQYTDAEYPSKRGWGHASAATVVDLAVQAGVRQCAIFHHDPMHSDDVVEEKIQVCRARARTHGSELVVFGAREGVELKL
nr:MAG: MBL fold metallo-hydrolase [Pseudomonadota bacterium]